MNYFQELLESYEMIKQRKFSVRLDERGEFQELEQTDPDRAAAIEQKLAQEFTGYKPGPPAENSTISIGNLPTTVVPEGATAGTMDLPAKNQAYAVTLKAGKPEDPAGTAVYYRRDGATTNAQIITAEGKVNTKELSGYRNALANSKGEIPMLGGDVDSAKQNAGNLLGALATPQIKTSLQNLIDVIRTASSRSDAEGNAWVDEPATYVVGNRGQSLEKKLANLTIVKLSAATGKLETVEMSDAVKSNMIHMALQSMENLYSMGEENASEAAKLRKCRLISNSIRKDRGGKIVALTDESSTEGIRFTPSPADIWFMDMAEKVCGDAIERTPIGKDGFDQHSINDFIGKTAEMASVVLTAMDIITAKGGNPKLYGDLADLTRKEIIKDLTQFRQAYGPWLQKVKIGSTDARGAEIAQLAQEVDVLIGGTEEEVMSLFMRLGRLQAPISKLMDSDLVLQTGKEKGQGVKADNAFVYIEDKNGQTPEERAKAVAKLFGFKIKQSHKKRLGDLFKGSSSAEKKFWMDVHGLSDSDLDREVYSIGNGLKTKAHRFTEMTLGESKLMLDVVAGNAKEMKAGYYADVKKRLGFSAQTVSDVREYNKELIGLGAGIDVTFPQGGLQVFDPDTGNTTLDDGKTQLDVIKELISTNSNFDELEEGELVRLFQDKKGNDLDLSDPVNMAKANEGLKRYTVAMKVKTDCDDRDKKGVLTPKGLLARQWFAYSSTLLGGTSDGLPSTVQDLENMETMSFDHNDTINDACKGIMNDSWDVVMPDSRTDHGHPGATVHMVNREDPKDKLTWKQTRAWLESGKAVTNGGIILGRHSAKKRAVIDEVVASPTLDTAETMLFSYLSNQQKILEGLVSLIKTN